MRLRTLAPVVVILFLFIPAAFAQNHAPFYVLDAFGGVHAAGGAPVIAPATPYFGFDVAASIEYVAVGTSTATGDGIIVLDKWGGLHYGGALVADPPSGGTTPYFGFDAARSVVRRDVPSRLGFSSQGALVDLDTASVTFTTLTALNIYAPTSGFLHVTGRSYISCTTDTGTDLKARLSANVDSTSQGPNLSQGLATWLDCALVTGFTYPTNNQTVSLVFPVAAGQHTVNLLGRKEDGTGTARYLTASLVAQFIAGDAQGQISMPQAMAPDATDLSLERAIR